MTQPKRASSRRQTQIPDDGIGQAHRIGGRKPDDAGLPKQANEATSSHQDSLRQDDWVTNFIGRLTGLVRHIGGKK